MSQTEQAEQQVQETEPGLPEQMFPARESLEVFLEQVEREAPACGASVENTRRFVEFLRSKYGKGIPESRYGRPMSDKFRAKYPEYAQQE